MGGASNIESIASGNKMEFDDTFSKTIGELPFKEKYLMNLLKPKRNRKKRKKGQRNRNGRRKRKQQKSISVTQEKKKWKNDKAKPQSKNRLDKPVFNP